MKKHVFLSAICFVLILLFTYAAFSKLFEYEKFESQLHPSQWLQSYAGILAWLVPAIELLISAMLAIIATRLSGLFASSLILLIFTVYIAGMFLFQEHLPCSCGGVIENLTWTQHLVFNLFFIGLSVAGILIWKKEQKLNTNKNISRE